MAKPELLVIAMSRDQFVSFAREARLLFEALENRVLAVNNLGAPYIVSEIVKSGVDFPFGIWANTPDQLDWDNGCTGSECGETRRPHSAYAQSLRASLKGRDYQPLAIQGYIAMEILLAAIGQAGGANADAVAQVLPGLKVEETALGPMTIRRDDHEANRGQFFGRVIRDPWSDYMGVERGALYVRP